MRDEEGDTPDWIELQNVSKQPLNLQGWTLSEESRRAKTWTFPSTNLASGQQLVIFASGKDRRSPGLPLHSNFKLPSQAGVLVLRGPGGETSQVDKYPPQVSGVSYGIPSGVSANVGRQVLIGAESDLRYFVAVDDRFGMNWISPGFNDARWRRGKNGIGYQNRGTFQDLIQTDVQQPMAGRCLGLYLRLPFTITNAAAATALNLQVQYHDGYVAWLNGVEFARSNAPDRTSWNSAALATHPDEKAQTPEHVPLPNASARLVNGTNYLAVHVLNASLQSSDLLFRATLDMPIVTPGQALEPATTYTYLSQSTPGAPNSAAAASGPRIDLLARQPAGSPATDEPIVISARISPARSAVSAVHLSYRVMFESAKDAPMFDDGQHGDGAAGDGVYGASIPAGIAQPGQMIRYAVLAEDAGGGRSRWPLFEDRREYSGYEGMVMKDPSMQTRLPVIELYSGKTDRPNGRRRSGNAVLFYGGELYDNISIRRHGQISRGFPKPSLNVDFPRDHHFAYRPDRPRAKRIKSCSGTLPINPRFGIRSLTR